MLLLLLPLLGSPQQSNAEDLWLDLPAGIPESFQVVAERNGKTFHLNLERQDLRSPTFRIFTSEGPVAEIPASRLYYGTVSQLKQAVVVASLRPEGLHATIFLDDGRKLVIEPMPSRVGPWHQIGPGQVAPPLGCSQALLPPPMPGNAGGRAVNLPPPSGGSTGPLPSPRTWKLRKSRIAFDATYDYWLREGQTIAGVTAGVDYQLGQNDVMLARDGLVSYELTGIVIRQSQYYQGTTSGALLSEFQAEWQANQSSIPRDSAVMLEDYQGDGIAGLAWVGTRRSSYAYAGLYWDRGYSPGIIAHEIGHNWGAGHIDCWPWGGSAMCGSWLLYGPQTSDIVQWVSSSLNMPVLPPYATPVNPYADPDYASVDARSTLVVDVLGNDHDANMQRIRVSNHDPLSSTNATISLSPGTGPGGRDELIYEPDRTRPGNYVDEFWYAAGDQDGLEQWTPVTVTVGDQNLATMWKLEEPSGSTAMDVSAFGNDGVIQGPDVAVPVVSAVVGRSCNTPNWGKATSFVDQDTSTDFLSRDQGPVSVALTQDPSDGTWIELDYGGIFSFTGFRHLDQSKSNDWVATSRLWFSTDTTFDTSDPSVDLTHHSHGAAVDYPFAAITARYVRWEVVADLDPNKGSGAMGGTEAALLIEGDLALLPPSLFLLGSNGQAGFSGQKLADGDPSTSFISSNQGPVSLALTTDPADGTWVEVDLGVSMPLTGASFLDLSGLGNWIGASRLWFSDSPTFSLSDISFDWNHGWQDEAQVVAFPAITARYVRWEVVALQKYTFHGSIGGRELAFFTDAASNPSWSRVADLWGSCLELSGPVSVSSTASNGVPTGASSPFTVHMAIQPASILADGTLLGGIGNADESDRRMFEIKQGNVSFSGLSTGLALPLGSWSWLTASWNGSLLRVFVDGIEQASATTSFGSCSSEIHLAPISSFAPQLSFMGKLDEFSVYDWALDDQEIAELLLGGAARGPSPSDFQTLIPDPVRLSWAPGLDATRHQVFLGTDFQSVLTALPGSSEHIANRSVPWVDIPGLTPRVWYFWRVDEITSNGSVIPGQVWRFRTALPWTAVVEEGFSDGLDGQHLNGLTGGTGFGAGWIVPANNGYKKRVGSIGAYPANVPFVETDGFFERKTVSSLSMTGARPLNSSMVDVDLGGDALYYFSFALQLNGVDTGATGMVGFQDPVSGEQLLAGVESGSWSIQGAAGNATGSGLVSNRTCFVVVKVVSSFNQADAVWMKVYNSVLDLVHDDDAKLSGVGSGANQWTLSASGSGSAARLNDLFIRAGGTKGYSTALLWLDEIRIGQSWTDVTGL